MVADTIGVNRSTATSIVARYIREVRIAERPRGGANNVRVANDMKDCLNDILNDNCILTLAQINQALRRCLPRKPRIHDRTVARTLDGMLFHFKIARRQPEERNRPDVIQLYSSTTAHQPNPGPNTELKKLPPYSPFLKADISRPEIQREVNNRDEARRQGIHSPWPLPDAVIDGSTSS